MSALLDIYSAIKAQEAHFTLPQTELTITIGTLDLQDKVLIDDPLLGIYKKGIIFDYIIPEYGGEGERVYGRREEPGPGGIPSENIRLKGGILTVANIKKLNIEMSIINWNSTGNSGNLVITLGAQTQTVNYNASSIIFENVTENEATFSVIVNNFLAIGEGTRPNSDTLKTLLPLKINWSQVTAGSITIPAIPVALVYAPVVDKQKKIRPVLQSRLWLVTRLLSLLLT